MNIHPIIVHFPIALLATYSVLELVRLKKLDEKPYWFYVKAVLVIIGAIFALITILTAPDDVEIRIAEIHEQFATISAYLYSFVALAYIGEWFWPSKYSLAVMRPYIIIPLALLGLISITITGGLGGAMVYGTNFDPFMRPIFNLLGV